MNKHRIPSCARATMRTPHSGASSRAIEQARGSCRLNKTPQAKAGSTNEAFSGDDFADDGGSRDVYASVYDLCPKPRFFGYLGGVLVTARRAREGSSSESERGAGGAPRGSSVS